MDFRFAVKATGELTDLPAFWPFYTGKDCQPKFRTFLELTKKPPRAENVAADSSKPITRTASLATRQDI